VPTVGDFLPGFEASALFGIAAPKNTPIEVVDKLNREINAIVAEGAFSKARNRPICRSSRSQESSLPSTSKRRRRLGSNFRPGCWYAPTR
jgi:tripartite-type tricarboxylate transporter receptor subunit TctC